MCRELHLFRQPDLALKRWGRKIERQRAREGVDACQARQSCAFQTARGPNRKRYCDRRRAKAGDSAHTLMPDVDLHLEAPRSRVNVTPTAPPVPGPAQANAAATLCKLQPIVPLHLSYRGFFFRTQKLGFRGVKLHVQECRRASAPRRSRSPRCAVVPPAERVCDIFAAAACACSTHRRTSVSRSCTSSCEHVKRAKTDGVHAGGEARAKAQGGYCGDHPRMS